MTELLSLKDAYLRQCVANLEAVEENDSASALAFGQTVFYPTGGGQPSDFGKIIFASDDGGKTLEVSNVVKRGGTAWHEVKDASGMPANAVGSQATLEINWERRHALMRMHTAAHVLGAVFFAKGFLFTGNQLEEKQSRIDFSVEPFDRSVFEQGVAEANKILETNAAIKVFELPREEALEIPGAVKLANVLPPSIAMLRVVEIEGVDKQIDGGTHVRSLAEVGKIVIEKLENKGSGKKRVYFSLERP